MITADHGCDPVTPSTDHSREYVFWLTAGKRVRPGANLGTLPTFADMSATILDYLGLQTPAVCFGTSVFRNPDKGWQIAYGNGYYQLETQDGVAVLGQEKEEVIGNGNIELLKAIVQQYNQRLINNQLKVK